MERKRNIFRQILSVLRDFLILMVLGNALSIFTIPGDLWSVQTVLRNCIFSVLIGYPSWKGIVLIVIYLEKKLPWLKYPIRRLIVQFTAMIIYTGMIIFIGLLVWVWLDDDFNFQSLNSVAYSSLKIAIGFLILSMIIGNAVVFFKNWRNAAIKQEELKRAQLDLQYQTLKNQIKPHFLFNSFSSLVTLINSDAEKATRFVHKLSDVYRYVLENSDQELVSVRDEIKFLEDYIYLQKIRFGANLQVSVRIDTGKDRMVIPLSLQMLVENAIKHNEASGEHPLLIEISSTADHQIIIKNNLNAKDVIEHSPGIGIENLKKRIAFFSGQEMKIENGPDEYIVSIPTLTY